MIFYLCYRR